MTTNKIHLLFTFKPGPGKGGGNTKAKSRKMAPRGKRMEKGTELQTQNHSHAVRKGSEYSSATPRGGLALLLSGSGQLSVSRHSSSHPSLLLQFLADRQATRDLQVCTDRTSNRSRTRLATKHRVLHLKDKMTRALESQYSCTQYIMIYTLMYTIYMCIYMTQRMT